MRRDWIRHTDRDQLRHLAWCVWIICAWVVALGGSVSLVLVAKAISHHQAPLYGETGVVWQFHWVRAFEIGVPLVAGTAIAFAFLRATRLSTSAARQSTERPSTLIGVAISAFSVGGIGLVFWAVTQPDREPYAWVLRAGQYGVALIGISMAALGVWTLSGQPRPTRPFKWIVPTVLVSLTAGSTWLAAANQDPHHWVDASSYWSYSTPLQADQTDSYGPVTCVAKACVTIADDPFASLDALISHDGGKSWTVVAKPGDNSVSAYLPSALSCWDASNCLATTAGAGLIGTSDGGRYWTTRPAPHVLARNIECQAAEHCILEGDVVVQPNPGVPTYDFSRSEIYYTTDGGATWNLAKVSAATATSGDMNCPTSTVCYLAGGTSTSQTGPILLKSVDGGATWTALILPADTAPLTAVSCTNAEKCVLLSYKYNPRTPSRYGDTFSLATDDAGQTWETTLVARGVILSALSCTGTDTCATVSDSIGRTATVFATTDHARSWQQTSTLPGLDGTDQLTSTSTGQFIVAGGEVITQKDGTQDIRGVIELSDTTARHWRVTHLSATG